MTNCSPPSRFFSLDALRGVAALSVVFWHWQHFFVGHSLDIAWREAVPFHDLLSVLYQKGWLAVDLFFSLSGFVFFWLYSESVAKGTITGRHFALLRFSRLYPLHIATLLFVAAGQQIYSGLIGRYFVYSYNDVWHLFLNLLFISSWGLERGYSFNGPIWSVSVEILLYALFFIFCRLMPIRLSLLLIVSFLGFLVLQPIYSPIGRGVGSFYLGGCVYVVYRRVLSIDGWINYVSPLSGIALLSWLLTIWLFKAGFGPHWLPVSSLPFLWRFDAEFRLVLNLLIDHWSQIVLFPLTILALALVESQRGELGKRLAFLGDASYAIYLLHFPLQLVVATFVVWLKFDREIFVSPWFMIAFFITLIALSLASHRFFELPIQKLLRGSGTAIRERQRAGASGHAG